MNDREEKFGIEAIKTSEQSPEQEHSIDDVNSPEALKEYGEEMQEKVDKDADEAKKDTDTELNEVVLDYTTSTKMPEGEISELRRKFGVDNRIHESFGKVDRAAALAKQEIGKRMAVTASA
jgi:ABC-type microcin C transport system permease subunit YejB